MDTRASHTMLPGGLLRGLGIEVIERVSFKLADERVVEYEVGEARLRLDERERTTLIVFGPDDALLCWAPPLWSCLTLGWIRWGRVWCRFQVCPAAKLPSAPQTFIP